MRLDDTTLPGEYCRQIIDLLLDIEVMRTENDRGRVLGKVRDRGGADWVDQIRGGEYDRADVDAIWKAASQARAITDLLGAIDFFEPSHHALVNLTKLLDRYRALVAANRHLYGELSRIVQVLRTVPDQTIADWLDRLRSLHSSIPVKDDRCSLRDLLLLLGEFPTDPDGTSFPLFTFLAGIATDTLSEPTAEDFRKRLDRLAAACGVTPAGIVRLRAAVAAMRNKDAAAAVDDETVADPSVLVVIEPDRDRQNPAHYFVRIYHWLPWESKAVADEMGSRGRATDVIEVFPTSCPLDQLLSDEGKAAIGREVWRRLRAWRNADASPIVEFLVPGPLLCEPFEAIVIDVLGIEQPLGMRTRVVVRPLERWAPEFREEEQLIAHWRRRWQEFKAQISPYPCWCGEGPFDIQVALGLLFDPNNEKRGLVTFGFAPVGRDVAAELGRLLLVAGIPVAVWARERPDGDPKNLLEATLAHDDMANRFDLRERIRGARTQALHTRRPSHLTLFWDDPERTPHPYDPDTDEGPYP